MWFGEIDICDPTILSKFAEDDCCRCDVFSSHWVAGKTAGGPPNCSTFNRNPTAKMTVGQDGPIMVTIFQPDTRCMHHPDRDVEVQNQMASVYITTTGAGPKNVVRCKPWARQKSETFAAKRGEVYYITAATFAPGQQGAFSIAVTGNGLNLEPMPFATPTPKEEEIMAVNWDPYPCCAACHNDINGSYFQVPSRITLMPYTPCVVVFELHF